MKSIEINTTQNVVIEYELAPLRERYIAFFLDLLILGLVTWFFYWFAFGLMRVKGTASIFFAVLPMLFFFLYHFLMESLNRGQSIGKLIMGLKVIRLDGRAPRWGDALLRSFFHWIDTYLSLSFVGGMLIKSSENSQRYGDIAANTTVIKIRGNSIAIGLDDVLNIMTLDDYEPVYPGVVKMTESDMLTIREIVNRSTKLSNHAHEDLLHDTSTHMTEVLQLEARPSDSMLFLKTLIKDYIVLTR